MPKQLCSDVWPVPHSRSESLFPAGYQSVHPQARPRYLPGRRRTSWRRDSVAENCESRQWPGGSRDTGQLSCLDNRSSRPDCCSSKQCWHQAKESQWSCNKRVLTLSGRAFTQRLFWCGRHFLGWPSGLKRGRDPLGHGGTTKGNWVVVRVAT